MGTLEILLTGEGDDNEDDFLSQGIGIKHQQ
jgi:hypothetical protein